MRIVVDALAARTGGGLTYLRSLLPAVRSADPELEFALVVARADVLPEFADTMLVEVPAARLLVRRLAWEQTRLHVYARELGASVIFCPSEIGPIRSSIPVVLGFQNPNLFLPPQPGESMRQRLRYRVLRAAAHASAKRADALVFVSDAFRRAVEPHLPATRAPRHTVTVGIDSRFSAEGTAGRFEPLRPYLLCVSDVYPYKGLPVAIDAFARLSRSHRDLRLVLAGRSIDARESARIDARIRAHALADRVVRLESVPYEEMPFLYRGAACLLFPSVVESLGLPPLEALACGVPVVATAASVMPDVLGDAVSFFPPADAAAAAAFVDEALKTGIDGAATARLLERHDSTRSGRALAAVFRGVSPE